MSLRGATLGFLALLALLALSVWLGFWPLGGYGWLAGLVVAGVKTGVVAVAFMGFDRASWEAKAAALAGVGWLAILLALAMADYLYR